MLVIDRRDHIAGNAYDYYDEHGVLVHKYGPHIFHTNSEKVVDYLSRFTEWRPYEHRVLARRRRQAAADADQPRRRSTCSTASDLSTDEEVEAFLRRARRAASSTSRTSEDVVVAKVGRELYEKFFRGYTRKQWERDPSELHASVVRADPDPHQHRRPLLHRLASRTCRPTATRRCSSGSSTTR